MPDTTTTLRISATLPKGEAYTTRDGGPSLLPTGADPEVTQAAAKAWLNETLPEAVASFCTQVGIPVSADEQGTRIEVLTRTLTAIRRQIPAKAVSLTDTDKDVMRYVAELRNIIIEAMRAADAVLGTADDARAMADMPRMVEEAIQAAQQVRTIPRALFQELNIPPDTPFDDVAAKAREAIATRVATEADDTQRGTIGSLLDAAGLGSTARPLGEAVELLAERWNSYSLMLGALHIDPDGDTDVVAQLSDRMRRIEDEAAIKARIKLLAVAGLPAPSAMSDERAAEALRSTLTAQARRGQAEAITALLDAADADEFTRPSTVAEAAELMKRLVAAPRCSAHGVMACGMCSRSLKPPRADGSCDECGVFAVTGMHWDTCANRDRSALVQQVGTYTEGVDFALKQLTGAAGLAGFDADGSAVERLTAAGDAIREKLATYDEGAEFAMNTLLMSVGVPDFDVEGSTPERLAVASKVIREKLRVVDSPEYQRLAEKLADIRRVAKIPNGEDITGYLDKTLSDLRASAGNRDLLATYVHAWISAFNRPSLHEGVDHADPKVAGRSLARLDQAIRTMIAANGELGARAEGRDTDLTGFVVQLLAVLRGTPGAPDVPESLEQGIREGGFATRAGALATLAGLTRQALAGSGEDAARLALRTIASVLRLPQDAAPALVAEKFSERTEAWLDDAAASDAAIDTLNELRGVLVMFLGAEKLESVEDYSDADIVRITERALLAERWPVGTPVEVRDASGAWMSGHIGAIEVFEDDGNPIGIMPLDDDEPLWFPADAEVVRASAAQARRMAGQEREPSPPKEAQDVLDEVGEKLAMHAEKLFTTVSKAFEGWTGGKR